MTYPHHMELVSVQGSTAIRAVYYYRGRRWVVISGRRIYL